VIKCRLNASVSLLQFQSLIEGDNSPEEGSMVLVGGREGGSFATGVSTAEHHKFQIIMLLYHRKRIFFSKLT
jgi:hypothetical protein